MNNLKPCHFCGARAEAYAFDPTCGSPLGYLLRKVECVICNSGTSGFDTEELAVKVWNTRTLDTKIKRIDGLIEERYNFISDEYRKGLMDVRKILLED